MRLKFVLGAVFVLALHEVTSQGQFEPGNTESLDVVANSVTNLAQKISRAIASPRSKTEIFSPVSIAGALSLLLLGSSGVTRDELTKLMGFDNQKINFAEIHKSFGKLFHELVSPEPSLNTPIPWRQNDKCNNYDYEDDEEPSPPPKNQRGKRDTSNETDFDRYSHEVQLANGIFVDKSFILNPQYMTWSQAIYRSEVERMSFASQPVEATRQINEWVSRNTRGKIPEIFPSPVDSNTVMVIASALYFKALWEEMFIEGATRPRDFYPEGRNGSSIKVDMMAHGGCFPFYDSTELDAKILGIPYKHNQTTMYVIKPNNSNRLALQELIAMLNGPTVDELINRMRKTTAVILFPKMHVSSSLNLKKTLKALGAKTLFSSSKSDLSGISSPQGAAAPATEVSSMAARPAVNLPDQKQPSKKKQKNPNRDQLIFSRIEGNETNEITPVEQRTTELPTTLVETTLLDEAEPTTQTTEKCQRLFPRDVSYKAPSESKTKPDPLTSKDFFLKKRIVKTTQGKKAHRTRRDTEPAAMLFVSDAIHKVDLEINERGTEGGAATAITLNRSGTNVVFRADEPFLLLIRSDKTKLPLFFGAVYDPSA
uniref:Putative serine proteinase inhibitor n=1 Tax=Culex tarsalis TaxID=7177 RepID=A0A1Q3FHY9_CULTA